MRLVVLLMTGSASSWPDPLRRQMLLIAVLFAILATAAALWRSRFAILATAILVVLTLMAAHVWKGRVSTTPKDGQDPAPATDKLSDRLIGATRRGREAILPA